MNTPAHAMINLGLLRFGAGRLGVRDVDALAWPILIGAVLPDVPMLVFYAVETAAGTPEAVIWGERYYAPAWQGVFDLPNSLVLIALATGLAAWRCWPWALALLASMAVHALVDLGLHHDDAHRHFWPVSDWRFASPVSYWDPMHYGRQALAVEVLLSVVAAAWTWRSSALPSVRAAVGALLIIYASFFVFAALRWRALG